MAEEMNKKQLDDYKKRAYNWQKIVKKYKKIRFNKEENTMIKFVIPLFEMLGWKRLDQEMEFEYYVKGYGLADIALYTDEYNDRPKILVEVKPIQDEFKDKWPTKIFQYISTSKVKHGVATNGKEIILYDRFRVRHDYKRGRRLLCLKLEDFERYSDILLLFSKRMIKNNVLDRFSEHYHEFYKWRKERKTGNRSHDEYKLRLDFAKDFLENKIK